MRLLFLALFFMSSQALALSWTSDITLSPTPMSWSGPADSIVPGKTIGSEWSASASVSEVFWCGLVFTCSKGTLEPSSSITATGITVILDGAN